jgi:hypothetical protein
MIVALKAEIDSEEGIVLNNESRRSPSWGKKKQRDSPVYNRSELSSSEEIERDIE